MRLAPLVCPGLAPLACACACVVPRAFCRFGSALALPLVLCGREYEEHACDEDWRDMDSIDEGMLGFECSDDDDDD